MLPTVDYIFPPLAITVLPMLVIGIVRKVKARLQNRIGAPIWQSLFDLLKLFRKDEVVSSTASWVFRFASAIVVAIALYLAILLPWFPKPTAGPCDLFLVIYLLAAMRLFTLLAAMDTASAFGAFAASREATLSFLVEPAAVLSLTALAVSARSSDLNIIFYGTEQHSGLWLLSGTALLLASLVELSRMPIDDPTTHLELTMVHEAMIIEASGKNLALFEFANTLKLCFLFGLSAQCYIHTIPGILSLSPLQYTMASITGLFAIAIVVGIFESVAVKLNWNKAPEFIAYALTFAFIASMIAVGVIL